MNQLIETWSDHWLDVLWRASWQGAIAILVAMAVTHCLNRVKAPAWVEHWLWRLVFLKLLLALVITQPIAVPVLAPEPAASAQPSLTATVDHLQPIAVEATTTPAIAGQLPVLPVTTRGDFLSIPDWRAMLLIVWLVGVAANLLLLLRQLLAAKRLKLIPLTDTVLNAVCRDLAGAQGLRRVPELATSHQIASPALIGWIQPVIVFPPETLQRTTTDQLRGVISHELSHYRRADLWWNLLPAMAQVFFFFHPLLWLANRRWRLSGEMACDANAIEHCSESVSDYAESLLRIAQLGSQRLQSQRLLGCVSIFDSPRSLKQRMHAMKDYQADSTRTVFLFATCIAIAGLVVTVPWQLVSRAAEPDGGAQVGDSGFGKNMGFEQKADNGSRAKAWGGGGEGYVLTLDTNDPQAGKQCARIQGKAGAGFGTYTQCMDAKKLRGKRVQFTGYLRSDLQGDGGLWMRVDGNDGAVAFDNMHNRRVKGKTEWTQHTIVLDVPETATKTCFGFLMVGKGDLWADNFTIAVTDSAVAGPKPTGMDKEMFGMPDSYANMDFEQESDNQHQIAKGWGGGGRGYELSRDTSTKHSGSASGRIKQISKDKPFGTFTQAFSAKEFRGKRVRYTGFLKSDDAKHAGLWMRVDGEGQESLAFDNMSKRPVTGTTDWTEYAVVLDVPRKARAITFGFLLHGEGTLWGDDLKLEAVGEVGEGPKSTAMKMPKRPRDLRNGDFEKADGKNAADWGGGGLGYELVRDTDEKKSGKASGRISRKTPDGKFGTFTQMFTAGKYKGKRVRLSGFLKSDDATMTGLWMRIDGPDRKQLGFDNMMKRPVKGTTDWTEYSVVLDVPENAVAIALGFLLIEDGTVWGDDLKLEIVGKLGEGPKTTNML